jgi:hypothetical protein
VLLALGKNQLSGERCICTSFGASNDSSSTINTPGIDSMVDLELAVSIMITLCSERGPPTLPNLANLPRTDGWSIYTRNVFIAFSFVTHIYKYPYNPRRIPMKYQLEIRAGEGGDDAKLFVNELMNSYIRMFEAEG